MKCLIEGKGATFFRQSFLIAEKRINYRYGSSLNRKSFSRYFFLDAAQREYLERNGLSI